MLRNLTQNLSKKRRTEESFYMGFPPLQTIVEQEGERSPEGECQQVSLQKASAPLGQDCSAAGTKLVPKQLHEQALVHT